MTNDIFIYGKLNKQVEKVDYEGSATDSITVTVDNKTRTISADFTGTIDFNRILGISGEITLSLDMWSEKTYEIHPEDFGENDAIFFSPLTPEDKQVIESCNMFVDTVGTTIIFSVENVPEYDINLNYFVARGRSNE